VTVLVTSDSDSIIKLCDQNGREIIAELLQPNPSHKSSSW